MLTKREREVALLACGGLSRVEVAAALNITVNTVKTHLERTYSKLGVANRIQMEHAVDARVLTGPTAPKSDPPQHEEAPVGAP
jgi:DNA-binding NarL/FixJ family response regulator